MGQDLSKVGIVGATGLVGSTLLQILEQYKLPISHLRLFASSSSKGQSISFGKKTIQLDVLSEEKLQDLGLIFFVTEADISAKWVPIAVKAGAVVIDNAATFRLEPEVPLIVPEVNGHLLQESKNLPLIANPNCSTIQMAVALYPLYKNFGIERINVATYQSVSGSGKAAISELRNNTIAHLERKSAQSQVYPHDIAFNNLPHIGSFDSEGFSTEEAKMRGEMRKIFDDSSLKVTAFCVRTPTLNAHSEAIWVRLQQKITKSDILSCLKTASGLQVIDDLEQNQYPLARQASDKDDVFVGRIHQDPDDDKTWLLWVVADNVRKGAALNAVQIAQKIINRYSEK